MPASPLASLSPRGLVAETTLAAYEEADLDRIARYYAPDATYHGAAGRVGDREALADNVAHVTSAIASLETTVEETVTDGLEVAFRYTIGGRHVGPLQGMRPTYEAFETQGIGLLRHDGAAVREVHFVFDLLGVRTQLGGL